MVSLDEPAHARLRKPAARAFSVKRINAMIPAIEATTARLLDAVAGHAEFDLVAALAFPLPAAYQRYLRRNGQGMTTRGCRGS